MDIEEMRKLKFNAETEIERVLHEFAHETGWRIDAVQLQKYSSQDAFGKIVDERYEITLNVKL